MNEHQDHCNANYGPEDIPEHEPPLTLEQKARDMRNAIDAMEIAMMGFGDLVELPRQWGEPRHRPELGVTLKVNCGQVYQVTDALAELTRIINSPGYELSR